jgi:hypothetical protein
MTYVKEVLRRLLGHDHGTLGKERTPAKPKDHPSKEDAFPNMIAAHAPSSIIPSLASNNDMVPITHPRDAMQFGNALPRLLCHVVLTDPCHGPVQLIKVDIADGFYRIGVRPLYFLKLGVAFPTEPDQPQLVAFPITLPMGWTNSLPIFCAVTETSHCRPCQRRYFEMAQPTPTPSG